MAELDTCAEHSAVIVADIVIKKTGRIVAPACGPCLDKLEFMHQHGEELEKGIQYRLFLKSA